MSGMGAALLEWIMEIAAGVTLALLLRRFVCLFARVKGNSMRDTLRNGDVVFALRRGMCRELKRFDVVLCRYPGRGRKLFVKRIVALPGERVALKEGRLTIDGELVAEDFPLRPSLREMPERALSVGEYFVMGDNRVSSHDSRSVGPIGETAIQAVAKCVVFPPKRWQRLR